MKKLLLAALLILAAIPAQAGFKLKGGGGGGGGGGPPVVPTIEPAAGWNGTASTCSAPSATVHGSGSVQPPIAGFDAADNLVVEGTYALGVGAATSNRAWISSVDYVLEGTTVNVVDPSENTSHTPSTFVWQVKVQSRSGGAGVGKNGDATLCAYIHPVNGVDRLVALPVWLNSNSSGDSYVDRMSDTNARYVDTATGADTGNCTGSGTTHGTRAAPYASIESGVACGVSGGVTFVKPGSYPETSCGAPACATGWTRYNSARGCGGADWPNGCAAGWNAGHRARYSANLTGARAIWVAAYGDMMQLDGVDLNVSNAAQVQFKNILFSNATVTDPVLGIDYDGGRFTGAISNDQAGFIAQAAGGSIMVQAEESTFAYSNALYGQFMRNVSGYTGNDVYVTFFPLNLLGSSRRHFNYRPTQPMKIASTIPTTSSPAPFTVEAASAFNVPVSGMTMVHLSDAALTISGTTVYARFWSGALAWRDVQVNSNLTYSASNVSNAVNDGTGKCKITVGSATGRAATQEIFVKGIVGATGTACNGKWIVSAVSGSDITLAGTTFAGAYTSGGSIDAAVMLKADASTAAAGDKVFLGSDWIHADCNQFQLTTDGLSPNYSNVYEQSYRCIGYGIQGFLPQAGSYTLSGTMTNSGTTVTFTAAQTLFVGDFIMKASGTYNLEAREIVAVNSTTNVTVANAYTANESGITPVQIKGTNGFACVACTFIVTGGVGSTNTDGFEASQLSTALPNWALLQSTFIGNTGFMLRPSTSTSHDYARLVNFALNDSIVQGLMTDSSGNAFPVDGADHIEHNQLLQVLVNSYCSGTPVSNCGTDNTVQAQTFVAATNPVTQLPNSPNVGNGTLSAMSVGASPLTGSYLIALTSATTFRVDAPNTVILGTGTVGTPFSSTGVNFTLAAGGTPFASGDRFYIAPTPSFKPTGTPPRVAEGMIGNDHKADGTPLWPWYWDGTARAAGALVGAQSP
jgi:hypothetical protein